jgi:hypothetical protein
LILLHFGLRNLSESSLIGGILEQNFHLFILGFVGVTWTEFD